MEVEKAVCAQSCDPLEVVCRQRAFHIVDVAALLSCAAPLLLYIEREKEKDLQKIG